MINQKNYNKKKHNKKKQNHNKKLYLQSTNNMILI